MSVVTCHVVTKKIYETSVERINESFMEGIKESTEIKMGVAHVACNGVCVCPSGCKQSLRVRNIKKKKKN